MKNFMLFCVEGAGNSNPGHREVINFQELTSADFVTLIESKNYKPHQTQRKCDHIKFKVLKNRWGKSNKEVILRIPNHEASLDSGPNPGEITKKLRELIGTNKIDLNYEGDDPERIVKGVYDLLDYNINVYIEDVKANAEKLKNELM